MLIALTGGARSGKSSAAVRVASSLGAPVTFIATATAGDAEMAERIRRHRADRPAGWTTIEAPNGLMAAVDQVDAKATIIIDCLSMWVSNRMLATDASARTDESATGAVLATDAVESFGAECAEVIVAEAGELGARLRARAGTAIVVTNEVGSGVVPATSLGRVYRDVLGSVNQAVVASASRACLVVAGRLLELRDAADGV